MYKSVCVKTGEKQPAFPVNILFDIEEGWI